MAELLTDLLAAGLIEKLEGDDERFAKMERAAQAVAQEFREHPPDLIGAILAGLDPDVPADDPAIAQAEQALLTEWKSMRSVHTSPPVGLFRAILLEACRQAAEGEDGQKAAILWLTAADTVQLVRLGKAEATVRRMLEELAARTEHRALVVPEMPASQPLAQIKVMTPEAAPVPTPSKVDRESLLRKVAAAAGPNYRNQSPGLPESNPSWTNEAGTWSWAFADRMHALLADALDALITQVAERQSEAIKQLQSSQTELVKTLPSMLTQQQSWIQEAVHAGEARQQAERLRLNALWWSEALYSQSMRCSYRELTPPLAAVVMAIDLLDQVTKPTPASVGYLLAEAVHRLPDAEFSRERSLPELLGHLRESRGRLPDDWRDRLNAPPSEGRLSLRDLIILVLGNQDWDLDRAMRRAGLTGDISLSLPALARAVFRQEQAVRLAGATQ
jgi:hypothetical protein